MTNKRMGTLYVVATPIGNLEDITLRAIKILQQVDKIAAEDTRHAKMLLKHFSIQKPMIALHDFNERAKAKKMIEYIKEGQSIALISDAGTPLISDPGFYLIREMIQEINCPIIPIPGACAAIAALSVAGLPTHQFYFAGFLSAKEEARTKQLLYLKTKTETLIFYEAPHRLISTLKNMAVILGDRAAVIARELTKIHESIVRGSLKELMDYYTNHPEEERGEIVILVAGVKEEPSLGKQVTPAEVLAILLTELPLKQAVALAAKISGEKKNLLYKLALEKND